MGFAITDFSRRPNGVGIYLPPGRTVENLTNRFKTSDSHQTKASGLLSSPSEGLGFAIAPSFFQA